MAVTDSALLLTIVDRVKRSERERLPLTSKSLAEELALLDIPGWRVESALYSLEYSRRLRGGEGGFLQSMMPLSNRGR